MCPELSFWRRERSARPRAASLLDLFSTSNIRSTSEEGFPGAGESCAPAPGKLFAGVAERLHSFSVEEKCVGFPGAGGRCVPAPGNLFPGTGEMLAGRWLV